MLQSGPALEANSRVVFIYRAVTHVSNLCWFHFSNLCWFHFSALWVFSVGTRIKVWTPDHLTWLAALQITLILIKAQTRLSASEPRTDGSAARFGLFALVLPASRYAQRSLWAARWPVGSHYCHHQRKSSCQIPSKPKGVRKMSVFFAPPPLSTPSFFSENYRVSISCWWGTWQTGREENVPGDMLWLGV